MTHPQRVRVAVFVDGVGGTDTRGTIRAGGGDRTGIRRSTATWLETRLNEQMHEAGWRVIRVWDLDVLGDASDAASGWSTR